MAMPHSTPSRRSPPLWQAWLALAFCLCCTNPAWAQNSAARVMAVSGQAKAIDTKGGSRILEKGAELFASDKVVTAEASLVQIRLHDGGYMSVRANTEMVIDRFVHDEKDPSKSNFLVSLLRGGFRSITGLIGRSNPNGYQIRTSTATIGIRGTDHEPVLVLDTPEERAQTDSAPGLYDKVNDGETFISSSAGVLSLKRGDIGFAPMGTELPPQVLLKIPQFYKLLLKIDARDAKDAIGDRLDGDKSGAGALLRPSLATRREAQSGAGAGATGGQAGGIAVPSTTNATAPHTVRTAPTGTGTGTSTGTGTAPVLTPEQKRAIVQTITSPTTQKSEPTAPNTTLTAPKTAPLTTTPITTTPLQR